MTTITKPNQALENKSQKRFERLRKMVRSGVMRCDCGRVAVKLKHFEPVCARCNEIEARGYYVGDEWKHETET